MKIALVSDWFHPRVGGIELHIHDLARRLTAAGHDTVVVTPTPGASNVDGVRVRRVDAPRMPRFGFLCTAAGVRAIGDALRDEAPDAAHCHVSIVSPAAFAGAAHAQRNDVPTVVTFHSIVPQTRALARAARMLLGAAGWRARYTAVSERVAGDVRPFAGEMPVTVLPNGVDDAFWRVEPTPHASEQLELITVMRLNAKKRPLALVRIVALALERLPRDARIRLRIVGDGPLAPALARAVRRAGLERVIELCGTRTRAEIRALFAESDLFILPTVRESFGLAALEARCAGLPVVAMAASGVAEIIHHAREGALARSDTELATHIAAFAADPERRRAIAEHNRATPTRFDWPQVVDSHLAVYREAIALRDSACRDRKP